MSECGLALGGVAAAVDDPTRRTRLMSTARRGRIPSVSTVAVARLTFAPRRALLANGTATRKVEARTVVPPVALPPDRDREARRLLRVRSVRTTCRVPNRT